MHVGMHGLDIPMNPPGDLATVFISPPRNVPLEIGHQLLDALEAIGPLRTAGMPMIAFSGLVVVAQNAFAIHDEGEPVSFGEDT